MIWFTRIAFNACRSKLTSRAIRALGRHRHSNARGVLFLSWRRPSAEGWGSVFFEIGITTREPWRGGIVRGLQEGAPVEWDIWSHRAIQQSLASAAHTNGWYRAATPSTARSSRAHRRFFLRLFFLPMARQDVNQWDAEKRRIHAPFRAPCSSVLFPSTLLARNSPECLSPLSSRRGFQGFSSPPAIASVSSFYLVGCRGAQRHGKKGSRIGPLLSSRSLLLSFSSVSSSVVLALSTSPWLPRCVGLWMLSLSYLAPPSWSLCDANEGTNTSTLSKSPPQAIPRNAETSIPMRQETRERGRT